MESFVAADSEYRDAVKAVGAKLPAAFKSARNVAINLDGSDLTNAILLRLRAFYESQCAITKKLQKDKAAPAADFFVETMAFFLTVALEKIAPDLQVKSEKVVKSGKSHLRPDISVFRGAELIAVIECKVQLGYSRNTWQEEFCKRTDSFTEINRNIAVFLLVSTEQNWHGFDPSDERVGTQWFAILDKTTTAREFEMGRDVRCITHRVEQLVAQIRDIPRQ